ALLVFAGRRDHLQRVIEPALAAGQTVLCDRFTDATFAYQGGGRGMDPAVLAMLEQWVQAGRQPDLTLWFDLPPAQAAQRRAAAREADRFEQQDLAFFERVRAAYAQRAADAPARFARIDASQSVAEVAAQIQAVMVARQW
ncbi:dTMP kinase, partial [Roseateles sp. GG27B]